MLSVRRRMSVLRFMEAKLAMVLSLLAALTFASCGGGGGCWGLDCGERLDELDATQAAQLCDEWYRDIDPVHYGRFRCEEGALGPVGYRDQCPELILDEIGWCDTTLGEFYDCFEPWYHVSCDELIEIGGTPGACASIRDRTQPCDE